VPVGTGDGTLGLTEVQSEGKPRMDAVAWANGAQPAGHRLGR
jgi:methionyl-tRNA formyltransferase